MSMNKLTRKEKVIAVAKRLVETNVDEVISMPQLSAAAGHDLTVDRWVVQAAMRAVNADFGIVFATVRGEGYRRLSHSEGALFAGGRGLYRIRRAGRTAMRTATNAVRHANDMSAEQRRVHNQQLASLGLIAHLTLARTVETMPEEPTKKRDDPLADLRNALGVTG